MFIFSIVPNGPPQNVRLSGIDPAILSVSYTRPLIQLHNGELTGYMIRYTRVNTGESQAIMVNGNITTSVISEGLVAFSNYSVEVAAVNINGTGPFSDPVIGLSGQDSEYLNTLISYCYC